MRRRSGTRRTRRVPLLAFVADDETETALRGGLLNTVEGVEIRRGTILHAIKHLAKEPTPRALVVDIAGVANPMDELDNLARVCTPDVKVLVIGRGQRRRLLSRPGPQHGGRRIRAQTADA